MNIKLIPLQEHEKENFIRNIQITFKNTVKKLQEGKSVVIFPEHDVKHNHIVYEFQDKFIDIAKLYYKKTGIVLRVVCYNGNLWFGAVLPITAAVLLALMVAFDDEEMLYWTAVPVWLIWICGLIWMSGSAMTFITHL